MKGRCPRPLDDGASAYDLHDGSSKNVFRDRRSVPAPVRSAAEFYAKLSKLPKLYMVTPRDRQDNGPMEHGGLPEKIGVHRVRQAVTCGNYSVQIRCELGSIESGGRNLLANP